MQYFTIRDAKLSDCDALCSLQMYSQTKGFKEVTGKEFPLYDFDVYHNLWKTRLNKKNGFTKVLFIGNILVSFIYYEIITNPQNEQKKNCLIKAVYTLPTHWGGGFGSKLLKQCFDEFNEKNVRQVSLLVLDQNKRANNLYQKFGFKFDSNLKKTKIGFNDYFLRRMYIFL